MSKSPPPPPGPPPEIKSAKRIDVSEDELQNLKLSKVDEKDKHYVTHLEMIQKMESQILKDQQEVYSGFLDKRYAKEFFDEPDVLKKKAKKLAKLIKKSSHFVVFTGAGISTAAGIPDFRSPDGEWTLASEGRKRTKKVANFIEAFPTFSHMLLVELHNRGILKYIISQNCDGIHLKSGIPRDRISELHGNVNVEVCEEEKCQKEYYRDWSAKRIVYGHDHFTGRYCDCGGRLLESTIDFNQNLPAVPLRRAYKNTKKCDLMLVLGSSCQVHPAAGMPKKVAKKENGNLVIVNIQKTPLHGRAAINIHAKIDEVMKIVSEELGISPSKWMIRRRVLVERPSKDEKNILVRSLLWNDPHIHSTTMFRKLTVNQGGEKIVLEHNERFQFEYKKKEKSFKLQFHWESHFKEPLLTLDVKNLKKGEKRVLEFMFDPYKREWIV